MSADRLAQTRFSRRAALAALASLTAGAGLALAPRVRARGRLPVGGKLAFRMPWPIDRVDPHRLDNIAAAVLGDALFDALYTLDATGAIVPALAESDPEVAGADVIVRIRSDLQTAHGRPIDSRDVIGSLARAHSSGAAAWLAEVPSPVRIDTLAIRFPDAAKDVAKIARALASPVTAIVPLAFAPDRPDGTGPFKADRRGDALVLTRNPRAARGPALLEEITVRAADLAGSLRSFETGADDLGWLGSGLHEPRAGSRPFDCGAIGWAILRAGREAGTWDGLGVPQRVADGIAPSRLSYLVVGPAWPTEREEGWAGAPTELLVVEDSPWLVELARAVAATVSRPGHELTVRALPQAELAPRLRARTFALAIDVARPLAPGALGAMVGLATADRADAAADLVKHPPRLGEVPARTLTRTMRVGVLGEIRLQGGRVADIALPPVPGGGWDLGLATRAPALPRKP
ncbi:MAG: Oligopeptide transporter, periplasmic oligopeptide-binding protein OppA [Myxococcaceae bacterium]|nr:Oligopeptide transporter, periplasmic oligopeptide-binding protein OppA [Myxococcaceae bacterium]